MSKKLRGNIMLILTALIWGSAFVAQSVGMEHLGPFTFNGVRCFIGSIVLIPVILVFCKPKNVQTALENGKEKELTAIETKKQNALLIKGGICCGIFLFMASSMQQIGIQYTTAGKAGFITALYIIFVPIFGLFFKKKVRPILWLCVLLGAIGLYLLCIKEDFSLGRGDLYVLICAFLFSGHILVIDYFSPKVDGVKMSCIQFFVCGVLSLIPMFMLENPEIYYILISWKPILYAGVLSCGVAYTLQIVAQKDTDPTVASLLLSLESVFAVIAGMLVLHETLSMKELLGCIIMFAAIILAQLPEKKKS